jgi:hypothetical protein
MGQKRRFGDVRVTSALPPKADIHRKGRHAAKGPDADINKRAQQFSKQSAKKDT